MSAVLVADGVSTGYRDLTVVRDVDLSLQRGTITTLLGRNGAGKTTLARGLSGLNTLSTGSVALLGEDVTKLPAHLLPKRGLAFVQEGKRIFRELSVEENLRIGCHPAGLTRREVESRVAAAYDRFPILKSKRHHAAGSLSGGQQQMIGISQALCGDPKVLILDEPSTGLAPSIVAQVLELIRELRDEGLAVLLIEQSVDAAVDVADHVVVLDVGRSVLDAPPSDALRHAIRDIYVGRPVGATDGAGKETGKPR
ncbi:ABC transporter ATP-binding protein [Pseudonocardia xishanensis]|uniref:ABC transporter ATP-binding protein n=1 Tax=Pseudonocardia xishanensis TaxID=630995 RepID=A0ABP8RZY0_9PSEU